MLDEYPSSDFVPEILVKLGIDPDTTAYDYPERRYYEAERLLLSDGDYETANEIFQSILDDFPESRYAPKASWAIAWSLANFRMLNLPDSTDSGDVVYDSTNILAFKKVADLYASTDYGASASGLLGSPSRVNRPNRPEPMKDTTDQESRDEEAEVDSAAIRDSILTAIEKEIEDLPLTPDRPTTQPSLEYPISAYSDPYEGPIKMKVKIDFTGKVTEWEILIGSGRDDIDEAVNKMMENTYFNAGEIDPLLYDSWFFYQYNVIPPQELRENPNQ
jgi:TonB family protein